MRRILILAVLLFGVSTATPQSSQPTPSPSLKGREEVQGFKFQDPGFRVQTLTEEQLLLGGWKFRKGAAEGAEARDYDDSRWERVTIPHDWAISGPFDKEIDKQVVAIEQNGEKEATEKTGRSGSLPWIGEGWYRRTFRVPEGTEYAELVFDGAMSEPTVYVNGEEAGRWKYGYSSFRIDVTKYLDKGEENVLAVHLQNLEESSRWYPGAGLYRQVRLVTGGATGLETWGTFARTTEVVYGSKFQDSGSKVQGSDMRTAQEARVWVTAKVRGVPRRSKYRVWCTLKDGDGHTVARADSEVNDSGEANNVLRVKDAKLWSPESPVLYTLVTEVKDGEKLLDRSEMKTGIRELEYTSAGFKLNGETRKFKGVCLHHDLGPLGSAFNRAAFIRQVRILQDMGCDAIRTSHNMPAPWQMDICDSLGMMVMAESFDMWVYPKCQNGYAKHFKEWWERDISNLVLCHRNHPSIVMWSIGNEIPDQGNATGLKYTRLMQELIHRLDGTRPCTQGFDRGEAPMWSGTWQAMDVPGFNYRLHKYNAGYKNSPKGFVLGSETTSTVSSRGVYKFPVEEKKSHAWEDGQCSGYDVECCTWSNLPDDDWAWQEDSAWVIGEFVWTGFDYLGEPTPYDEYWPSRSSYFGIVDLAGLPKDRYWLYRSHWNQKEETIHLLPHWTWPGKEGENVPVYCYTNWPTAELFVNGKSQGKITKQKDSRLDRFRLRWNNVVYEPGEVKVVVYDENGVERGTRTVKTAGKPHHLDLSVDRPELRALPLDSDGLPLSDPDLAFVTVSVVDKDGNLCPDADCQLNFKVSGKSALFKAVCNGDATSTEVFTAPTMKAFHGQLTVVVEAGSRAGLSTLKVWGKGVQPATAKIQVSL